MYRMDEFIKINKVEYTFCFVPTLTFSAGCILAYLDKRLFVLKIKSYLKH